MILTVSVIPIWLHSLPTYARTRIILVFYFNPSPFFRMTLDLLFLSQNVLHKSTNRVHMVKCNILMSRKGIFYSTRLIVSKLTQTSSKLSSHSQTGEELSQISSTTRLVSVNKYCITMKDDKLLRSKRNAEVKNKNCNSVQNILALS
jgi:hypothetical protein